MGYYRIANHSYQCYDCDIEIKQGERVYVYGAYRSLKALCYNCAIDKHVKELQNIRVITI